MTIDWAIGLILLAYVIGRISGKRAEINRVNRLKNWHRVPPVPLTQPRRPRQRKNVKWMKGKVP